MKEKDSRLPRKDKEKGMGQGEFQEVHADSAPREGGSAMRRKGE